LIPIHSYLYLETNINKTKWQVILSLGDFRQFFCFWNIAFVYKQDLFYFIFSNLCCNQIGYHSQKDLAKFDYQTRCESRKFKNPFTYWLVARAYYKDLEYFFTEIWQIRAIFQNEIHYYNMGDFCVAKFLTFIKKYFKKEYMVINNFFQIFFLSNNDIFYWKHHPKKSSQSIGYNNMKGCLRFSTFTFWILSKFG
jgi:hypothetical protein